MDTPVEVIRKIGEGLKADAAKHGPEVDVILKTNEAHTTGVCIIALCDRVEELEKNMVDLLQGPAEKS